MQRRDSNIDEGGRRYESSVGEIIPFSCMEQVGFGIMSMTTQLRTL